MKRTRSRYGISRALLAARIEHAIMLSHGTQTAFAAAYGNDCQPVVSNWCTGERSPFRSTLERIAEVTGRPLEEFVTRGPSPLAWIVPSPCFCLRGMLCPVSRQRTGYRRQFLECITNGRGFSGLRRKAALTVSEPPLFGRIAHVTGFLTRDTLSGAPHVRGHRGPDDTAHDHRQAHVAPDDVLQGRARRVAVDRPQQ